MFGRDPSSAGCLPSASVSRQHAEIRWSAGTVPMLRDLDSRNGIFVNGRAVKQAPLKIRDVLRIGDWIGVLVPLDPEESASWGFAELTKGYWAGPALEAALAPLRMIAVTDLPIIIEGATGVGKEGAAQTIHAWSRRSGPFLAVNCAALPESLAEAQLFGHRKGAFTNADRASPGHLRAAAGGTLFLDEIAELPMPIQAKLLRALEQREVIPVGDSAPVAIDIRVVVATQSPLPRLVDDKRFRGDLYARLEGMTVVIPALKERNEEVPFLFAKLVEQFRGPGAAPPRFDSPLIERLCAYDWPFNVRELSRLAMRMVALHRDAVVFDEAALSRSARPDGKLASTTPDCEEPAVFDESDSMPDPLPVNFLAKLREHRGNVKQTAIALGMSRGQAYRLMEKIGSIDLAEFRRDASAKPPDDE
jgi:DNA-binding NtrC family response regulator